MVTPSTRQNTKVATAIHAAPLAPASMLGEKDFAKSFDINTTAAARLIAYVAAEEDAATSGTEGDAGMIGHIVDEDEEEEGEGGDSDGSSSKQASSSV